MKSWNESIHFCDWTGVTCSTNDQRVVVLSLESQGLVGTLSPSVGNLSFLTGLNLKFNNFEGTIPGELGRLSRLQSLNISGNSFYGEIPLNLTKCFNLEILDLVDNKLTGNIPHQLSYLKKLVILGLGINNLVGTIPQAIGNLSSLSRVSVALNRLHGSIPDDFGRLSRLSFFIVYGNMLSGIIPPSIYNISSMYYFSVADNKLLGSLPYNLGFTLPNLKIFAAGVNNFHGEIPDSFSNATWLQVLDLAENNFTGPIPMSLGRLRDLTRLNFGSNRLGSGKSSDLGVIDHLINCTHLEVLGLDHNHLRGKLPDSIGNLSTYLSILTIGGNIIHGILPTGIENLVNLTLFGLEANFITGSIPYGIGKLQKIGRMDINDNMLSGTIPSSLGNLTLLDTLYMQGNRLGGSIPPSLGNCQMLALLDLSHNNLTGTLPKQLVSLTSLTVSFSVSHNSLNGSLPLEVGNLINLVELEVSANKLSGEIPVTLGNCLHLERLIMSDNLFYGIIPKSLIALKGIEVMDLSHNNISGQIPDYLRNFSSLTQLDLSFNDLSGEVPKEGIFKNTSRIMLNGNKKLCGGIQKLHLPLCIKQAHHPLDSFFSDRNIILESIGILFLVLLSVFCTIYWFRKLGRSDATSTSFGAWKFHISYSDIFKSTNGFSSDCLLGEGSFGSVYKGVLFDGITVYAIKVLKLETHGASKSFLAECDALKNIRHRNLLKVITTCASVDFEGNDFKALVFEFMSNGSLEEWLHSNIEGEQQLKILSLKERLNIAIDIAFGLEYLHCFCETTIVHCDLKPRNILLDEDMVAHVGDLGLARFILEETDNAPQSLSLSSGLKGTIGYIPPEYSMGGQVSTHGDMYSYGIVLLEMFTGKQPTNDMFRDGLSLYNFTMRAMPNHILEIVDPLLIQNVEEEYENQEEDNENEIDEETSYLRRRNMEIRTEECLHSVITIGLSCCAPLPKDRMEVSDVVTKMIAIRDLLFRASQRE